MILLCDDCVSVATLQVMFGCCSVFIGSCYALNDFHFNLITNTGALDETNDRVFSACVLLACASCRPSVSVSAVEVVDELHFFTRTSQPCIKPRLNM